MLDPKKVNVYGLGYVGLPTICLLLEAGQQVLGIDIDNELLNRIRAGELDVAEPGVSEILGKHIALGSLQVSNSPLVANVHIVCVPTPIVRDNDVPTADLHMVMDVARTVASVVKNHDLVLLESTCPVGTLEKFSGLVEDEVASNGINANEVLFAYCPERVLPGNALEEIKNNDRVVGGLTEDATFEACSFLNTYISGKIIPSSSRLAELCKLAENTYRDVNIGFANELSLICDRAGVNVYELINLMNMHPRVNALMPGCGVGGHCIALDPWFLISEYSDIALISRSAREINNCKPLHVVEKVIDAVETLSKNIKRNPSVACLGIAYKPNVGDVRESPALMISEILSEKLKTVCVVDPFVDHHNGLNINNLNEALRTSDIIVALVPHAQFVDERDIIFDKSKIVLDFCGLKDL